MDDGLPSSPLSHLNSQTNNSSIHSLRVFESQKQTLTNREEQRTCRAEMASMTMTASFLAGSTMAKQPLTTPPRRGIIVAKASRTTEGVNVETKNKEESSSGRRDLMFAAAAAAACSIARVAIADEEPERGTPEAKKKYAPVCVTMPTARICRK
ncbi:photosystem II 5 kDa protein [Populus alba x Populus x berolinensis]|nr:photosystem II 5 kDa protein [Populus alba x Populus x berolinensis]